MPSFLSAWKDPLVALGILAAAAAAGVIANFVLWQILTRVSRRSRNRFDDSLVRHGRRPVGYIIPFFTMRMAYPLAGERLPAGANAVIESLLTLGMIAAVAWALLALLAVISDVVTDEERIDVTDNLQARKIRTQMQILQRILGVLIVILALGAMLMSYDKFRQLGQGILASAGIAGIVLGLAAQKTLANLLAGFQIAISQPIRIDDVVIVEGEWGRIEEITLTYVVVRIWDLRRLVVPISYFIEKPFQNWTRVSADLLGTVYLYLDYLMPVEEIRGELHRLLKASDDWDGKVEGVQVTGADARTMEVRTLMSASDSGKLWNLRCSVREALIAFVRERHPGRLPRFRAELDRLPEEDRPGSDGARVRREDSEVPAGGPAAGPAAGEQV